MLYDHKGSRKYLTSSERRAFLTAALEADEKTCTFGLTLAYTGARISEVLEITPSRIDFSAQSIVIRTLKRRRNDFFRTVPVPTTLLDRLECVHGVLAKQYEPELSDQRLWCWSRTAQGI